MADDALFSSIDTVLLRVQDVGAAKSWYRDKLGMEASYEDEAQRLVVLDAGAGTSITLWELKRGETPAAPGSATTYPILAVENAQYAWRALRERGVLVDPVTQSAGVTWFQFRDLDGNRLEACQVH